MKKPAKDLPHAIDITLDEGIATIVTNALDCYAAFIRNHPGEYTKRHSEYIIERCNAMIDDINKAFGWDERQS